MNFLRSLYRRIFQRNNYIRIEDTLQTWTYGKFPKKRTIVVSEEGLRDYYKRRMETK